MVPLRGNGGDPRGDRHDPVVARGSHGLEIPADPPVRQRVAARAVIGGRAQPCARRTSTRTRRSAGRRIGSTATSRSRWTSTRSPRTPATPSSTSPAGSRRRTGKRHGLPDPPPDRARQGSAPSANLSVTEICLLVGFESLGSFSVAVHGAGRAVAVGYRRGAVRRGGPPPIPGCFLLMWTRPPRHDGVPQADEKRNRREADGATVGGPPTTYTENSPMITGLAPSTCSSTTRSARSRSTRRNWASRSATTRRSTASAG